LEEFREELKKLGATEFRNFNPDAPEQPYIIEMRNSFLSEVDAETRSTPRVHASDRRTLDTRARLAEQKAVLAAHEAAEQREFRDFLKFGNGGLGEERAQSVGTDSAGGYLAPVDFYNQLLVALKAYDGIFDVATVVQTEHGNACTVPIDDDSGQAASVIAENGTSSSVDAVFDRVSFGKIPTWRSGHVRASIEIAQDSAFDLTALLARAFARRFARGIAPTFTTSLLSQATLGKTAASATAVTPDELLDLMASLDAAWAQQGSFAMNFATFMSIAKVKASTGGSYLAPISNDAQGRPTIFGRTCYLSPSMPAMTTGLKSVVFGDLSRFLRREVANSLKVRTYVERYAEVGQVAWEGFWRVDGALAKAANSPVPVKYLIQA